MYLLIFALVAATLACWVYLRWLRCKSYWAERNVPFVPPHPILGNLTFFQKEHIVIWLRKLYKSFRSPYVGIWLCWRPALVINSPEIARNILIRDSDVFRNRLLGSGSSDPTGSLNIFCVDDPTWTAVRKRLTPTFTSAKLKALEGLIATKSKELVQRIRIDFESGVRIDLKSLFSDFSTDIICTASMGVASDATLTGDSAMRRITRDFQVFRLWRTLQWIVIFFIPELRNVIRARFFPKSADKYFKKIFREVVAHRGGYDQRITEPRDLVDILINIKHVAALDNEEMSEDLIIAQAAIFIEGGFGSTGSALSFLVYELAYHPKAQDKLYREVSEAKKTHHHFNNKILQLLPHLNSVIKEALRKYPSMGWLDRIASKDYAIDENLTIPAGTPVYVNMAAIHVDPQYFPNPEKFDPDRFLPENADRIIPMTYSPFGDGPRACIGLAFTMQVLRFAVANIMLNFEIRPLEKQKSVEDLINKYGLFLAPKSIDTIEFVPRIDCIH